MEQTPLERMKQLTHVSVKNMLENSSWGEDFVSAQLDILALYFLPYSAPVGTVMHKEGEANDFFALICEGAVNVVKESSLGPKTLLQLNTGKAFGEMSFFDGGACSASIVVKDEVTMLVMTKKKFAELKKEATHLALELTIKLIRTISSRLRQTSGQLIDHLH